MKNPQNAFLKEAHKLKINGATYDQYGFLELFAEELVEESQSNQKIIYVDKKGKATISLDYFIPFYVNSFGETSRKMEEVYKK